MSEPASRATRWLPALAVLAAAWLALFPITSVDAYYHLATGKRILESHAIPERGVGSATFGSSPWHDNEWGFQALAAAIGRTVRDPEGALVLTPAGRAGLILLRALSLAATLALLSAQMGRAGVGPVLRALGVVLAAFLTFGNLFWDVRPQILSYLGFAAIGYLLERARGARIAPLAAALGVIAVWANVHGAFVLGIVLLGCEAAGAWLEAVRGQSARSPAIRLSMTLALAPVAACLNPLGWRQVTHPFVYLARPEIYAGNNEWTRPDLSHLPLLLLTVCTLVAAIALGARPRAGLLLRVAAFGILFLSAIRHLPLLTLAIVPVLACSLAEAAGRGGRRALLDPGSSAWGGPGRRLVVSAALVVVIAALSGAKFISARPRFAEVPSRPLPEREVRYLIREGVSGAGFNGYRFGGFLMFRMYPEERVFMDGRNDLYGTFRARVYDPILKAEPGWQDRLRDATATYRVGWVLIDAADPLAAGLEAKGGWRRVSDAELGPGATADGIVLFVRSAG